MRGAAFARARDRWDRSRQGEPRADRRRQGGVERNPRRRNATRRDEHGLQWKLSFDWDSDTPSIHGRVRGDRVLVPPLRRGRARVRLSRGVGDSDAARSHPTAGRSRTRARGAHRRPRRRRHDFGPGRGRAGVASDLFQQIARPRFVASPRRESAAKPSLGGEKDGRQRRLRLRGHPERSPGPDGGPAFHGDSPALAPASRQLGADKTKNPREVTIRCFPACALEGRVVDTESRPVAGARVWAWARDSSQGLFGSQTNIYEGKDPWSSVTGGDGTYRLERLPVGDGKPPTVSVRAETPQKVNQLQGIAADARVDVAPNQTIHVKDLVLPSEVSAAVVFVTDGHGAPVAGAHVQIEDTWCEAFTDSKGMARVHFREGGDAFPPVRMRIRAPGFMVAHTPPFIASAKEPPRSTSSWRRGDRSPEMWCRTGRARAIRLDLGHACGVRVAEARRRHGRRR